MDKNRHLSISVGLKKDANFDANVRNIINDLKNSFGYITVSSPFNEAVVVPIARAAGLAKSMSEFLLQASQNLAAFNLSSAISSMNAMRDSVINLAVAIDNMAYRAIAAKQAVSEAMSSANVKTPAASAAPAVTPSLIPSVYSDDSARLNRLVRAVSEANQKIKSESASITQEGSSGIRQLVGVAKSELSSLDSLRLNNFSDHIAGIVSKLEQGVRATNESMLAMSKTLQSSVQKVAKLADTVSMGKSQQLTIEQLAKAGIEADNVISKSKEAQANKQKEIDQSKMLLAVTRDRTKAESELLRVQEEAKTGIVKSASHVMDFSKIELEQMGLAARTQKMLGVIMEKLASYSSTREQLTIKELNALTKLTQKYPLIADRVSSYSAALVEMLGVSEKASQGQEGLVAKQLLGTEKMNAAMRGRIQLTKEVADLMKQLHVEPTLAMMGRTGASDYIKGVGNLAGYATNEIVILKQKLLEIQQIQGANAATQKQASDLALRKRLLQEIWDLQGKMAIQVNTLLARYDEAMLKKILTQTKKTYQDWDPVVAENKRRIANAESEKTAKERDAAMQAEFAAKMNVFLRERLRIEGQLGKVSLEEMSIYEGRYEKIKKIHDMQKSLGEKQLPELVIWRMGDEYINKTLSSLKQRTAEFNQAEVSAKEAAINRVAQLYRELGISVQDVFKSMSKYSVQEIDSITRHLQKMYAVVDAGADKRNMSRESKTQITSNWLPVGATQMQPEIEAMAKNADQYNKIAQKIQKITNEMYGAGKVDVFDKLPLIKVSPEQVDGIEKVFKRYEQVYREFLDRRKLLIRDIVKESDARGIDVEIGLGKLQPDVLESKLNKIRQIATKTEIAYKDYYSKISAISEQIGKSKDLEMSGSKFFIADTKMDDEGVKRLKTVFEKLSAEQSKMVQQYEANMQKIRTILRDSDALKQKPIDLSNVFSKEGLAESKARLKELQDMLSAYKMEIKSIMKQVRVEPLFDINKASMGQIEEFLGQIRSSVKTIDTEAIKNEQAVRKIEQSWKSLLNSIYSIAKKHGIEGSVQLMNLDEIEKTTEGLKKLALVKKDVEQAVVLKSNAAFQNGLAPVILQLQQLSKISGKPINEIYLALQKLGMADADIKRLANSMNILQKEIDATNYQHVQRLMSDIAANVTGMGFEQQVGHLRKARAELSDLEKTYKGLSNEIKGLSAGHDAFSVSIKNTQNFIERLIHSTKNLITFQAEWYLGSNILFAGMAALGAIYRQFIELDQSLKNIQAAETSLSNASIRALNDEMLRLSTVSPLSANEVSKLALQLVRAGLSAQDAANAMGVATKVATISGEDMKVVADAISTAILAYKKSGDEIEQVGNVISIALNKSRLTVQDLAVAYNYVASTTKNAGISFEETNAVLAEMSNIGVRASTMATGWRQFMADLMAPSRRFRELLSSMKVDIESINPNNITGPNKMAQIFEILQKAGMTTADAYDVLQVRSAAFYSAMTNIGTPALRQMYMQMNETNQSQKAFDISMQGLGNRLKEISNTFQAAITLALQLLGPALVTLLNIINAVASGFYHLAHLFSAIPFSNYIVSITTMAVALTLLGNLIFGKVIPSLVAWSLAQTVATATAGKDVATQALHAATMTVDTVAVNANTAGKAAAIGVTGTLAAATSVLTARVWSLTLALARNPIGALLTGLTLLAGFAFLDKYLFKDTISQMEDLTKSVKLFEEEIAEGGNNVHVGLNSIKDEMKKDLEEIKKGLEFPSDKVIASLYGLQAVNAGVASGVKITLLEVENEYIETYNRLQALEQKRSDLIKEQGKVTTRAIKSEFRMMIDDVIKQLDELAKKASDAIWKPKMSDFNMFRDEQSEIKTFYGGAWNFFFGESERDRAAREKESKDMRAQVEQFDKDIKEESKKLNELSNTIQKEYAPSFKQLKESIKTLTNEEKEARVKSFTDERASEAYRKIYDSHMKSFENQLSSAKKTIENAAKAKESVDNKILDFVKNETKNRAEATNKATKAALEGSASIRKAGLEMLQDLTKEKKGGKTVSSVVKGLVDYLKNQYQLFLDDLKDQMMDFEIQLNEQFVYGKNATSQFSLEIVKAQLGSEEKLLDMFYNADYSNAEKYYSQKQRLMERNYEVEMSILKSSHEKEIALLDEKQNMSMKKEFEAYRYKNALTNRMLQDAKVSYEEIMDKFKELGEIAEGGDEGIVKVFKSLQDKLPKDMDVSSFMSLVKGANEYQKKIADAGVEQKGITQEISKANAAYQKTLQINEIAYKQKKQEFALQSEIAKATAPYRIDNVVIEQQKSILSIKQQINEIDGDYATAQQDKIQLLQMEAQMLENNLKIRQITLSVTAKQGKENGQLSEEELQRYEDAIKSIDTIIGLNKVLYDKKMAKESLDAISLGIKNVEDKWHDYRSTVTQITEQAYQDSAKAFSDIYFDAITGKLKTLGDYFDSIWQSILRGFVNILGQMTAESIARPIIVPVIQSISGTMFGGNSQVYPAGITNSAGGYQNVMGGAAQLGSYYNAAQGMGMMPSVSLFGEGGIGGAFNGLFGKGYGSGMTYVSGYSSPIGPMPIYNDTTGGIVGATNGGQAVNSLTPFGYAASGLGVLAGGYGMYQGISSGNSLTAGLGGFGFGMGAANLLGPGGLGLIGINPILGGLAAAVASAIAAAFADKDYPRFAGIRYKVPGTQGEDAYTEGDYTAVWGDMEAPAAQSQDIINAFRSYREGLMKQFARYGLSTDALNSPWAGFGGKGADYDGGSALSLEGKTAEQIKAYIDSQYEQYLAKVIPEDTKALIDKFKTDGQSLREAFVDVMDTISLMPKKLNMSNEEWLKFVQTYQEYGQTLTQAGANVAQALGVMPKTLNMTNEEWMTFVKKFQENGQALGDAAQNVSTAISVLPKALNMTNEEWIRFVQEYQEYGQSLGQAAQDVSGALRSMPKALEMTSREWLAFVEQYRETGQSLSQAGADVGNALRAMPLLLKMTSKEWMDFVKRFQQDGQSLTDSARDIGAALQYMPKAMGEMYQGFIGLMKLYAREGESLSQVAQDVMTAIVSISQIRKFDPTDFYAQLSVAGDDLQAVMAKLSDKMIESASKLRTLSGSDARAELVRLGALAKEYYAAQVQYLTQLKQMIYSIGQEITSMLNQFELDIIKPEDKPEWANQNMTKLFQDWLQSAGLTPESISQFNSMFPDMTSVGKFIKDNGIGEFMTMLRNMGMDMSKIDPAKWQQFMKDFLGTLNTGWGALSEEGRAASIENVRLVMEGLQMLNAEIGTLAAEQQQFTLDTLRTQIEDLGGDFEALAYWVGQSADSTNVLIGETKSATTAIDGLTASISALKNAAGGNYKSGPLVPITPIDPNRDGGRDGGINTTLTWAMMNKALEFIKGVGGKVITPKSIWEKIPNEDVEQELWELRTTIGGILSQDLPKWIRKLGEDALNGSIVDLRDFFEFSQKLTEFYKSLIPEDERLAKNKQDIDALFSELGTGYETWKEDARRAIESGTLTKEQLQRWMDLGELMKDVTTEINRLKDAWKSLAGNLKDTIKSLTMGSDNPADIFTRMNIARDEMDRLKMLYQGATGDEKLKYAEQYSKALQDYLKLSQEAYQKPSPEYQSIYDMIIKELTRLANEADVNSTNDNLLNTQIASNTLRTAQAMESLLDLYRNMQVPAFAEGGYVTRPTYALIGERGAEYVIPERKLLEMRGGVTIAPTINITANGSDIDEKEIVDLVMEKIERSARYGALSKIN